MAADRSVAIVGGELIASRRHVRYLVAMWLPAQPVDAKAMGLTISEAFLLRADAVLE